MYKPDERIQYRVTSRLYNPFRRQFFMLHWLWTANPYCNNTSINSLATVNICMYFFSALLSPLLCHSDGFNKNDQPAKINRIYFAHNTIQTQSFCLYGIGVAPPVLDICRCICSRCWSDIALPSTDAMRYDCLATAVRDERMGGGGVYWTIILT